MTEKQLLVFCNKEINKLRKIEDNKWKKHDDIYGKEGMEKASEYLESDKKATSEKLDFLKDCRSALFGLGSRKELINNGGKWIQNYRKKFLTKLEKFIKSYDPEDNYKEFKKKRDSAFDENTSFLIYDRMFNDIDFVELIDDIADYNKRQKIINKFNVAIDICDRSSKGKIGNHRFVKNKSLDKDCEALLRATEKLEKMSAKAKLSTDDIKEFYENAVDMIDEYKYAKKIYESLSKKLKSKTDKKSKEYGIEESVNYFPY